MIEVVVVGRQGRGSPVMEDGVTRQQVSPVVPCVGAIIMDAAGALLLIQRARDPGRGLWSLPGGRVEPGESPTAALVREVREETGLDVTVGPLVGTVRRPGPGGVVYDIADYACDIGGGVLAAGDDAADARWCADLNALPLTEGLLDALTEWGITGIRSEPKVMPDAAGFDAGGL